VAYVVVSSIYWASDGPYDSHFLVSVVFVPVLLGLLEVGGLLRWLLGHVHNLSTPAGVGAGDVFLVTIASFLFMTVGSSVAAGFEAYKKHSVAPDSSPPSAQHIETKKDR
jgi:hypothetical protein